jgi:hypothetical protein
MAIERQKQHDARGGPMSVEEYLELDRNAYDAKYEYVDGVARMMSGGSSAHDRIAFNMRAAFDINFLSGPCTVFGSDMQAMIGTKPDGKIHYVASFLPSRGSPLAHRNVGCGVRS